jgi:hypothetical protein
MSDRKYRHRGYQDDDRDREPKPKRTPDRGRGQYDNGPRGRGLGAPTTVAFKCAVCGHSVQQMEVEFDTSCPSCAKPLHSCTNCDFFDTSARFECRKPIEERVDSKVKANRCEFFRPKAIRDLRSATQETPEGPQDARSAFDALFKK